MVCKLLYNHKKLDFGESELMKKIIVALLAISCIFMTGCSKINNKVSTDISRYEIDCQSAGNADVYMPKINSLGNYLDIKYTYKVTCYSWFMNFCSDGLALFVKYDQETYENEKLRINGSYEFLKNPIGDSDYFELPVTEFEYKGYLMKVVPDQEYIDYCACKSFLLIGFSDEKCAMAFLYFYDADIDYISERGEDPNAEMQRVVDGAFSWVAF